MSVLFKTSHAFSGKELYANFNTKQLNLKANNIKEKYKVRDMDAFCSLVLSYCFLLIFLDMVENNTTFIFPLLAGKQASFEIAEIEREKFKYFHDSTAFDGLDVLQTQFKGYCFNYRYQKGILYINKPMYITKWIKEILFNNINNGKQYY